MIFQETVSSFAILLLTIVMMLAPEYYAKYVCCAVESDRIVLNIFFYVELSDFIVLIVYLIHLRNERLRIKYNIEH